jgi:hypothetical protein
MTMDLGTDLAWAKYANCKGQDTEAWVTEKEDDPVTAQQELTCGMCKVRGQCLEYATANDVEGVWAGTNSYQRRVMQVPRNRAKCPGCTSRDVTDLGSTQICMSCGISWENLLVA